MKSSLLNSLLLLLLLLTILPTSQIYAQDRDADGLTPLHLAAGRGDSIQVESLISKGADIFSLDSRMGVSILHKAVYSGDPKTVAVLLKHGALINIQSPSNGDTPLHDAIYFKRKTHGLELIDLLLHSGASLSIRNRAGLTPLDSAELLKDQEAILSIKKEQDLRYSSSAKKLMSAVRTNDLNAVAKLLSNHDQPFDDADDQGFTPLLWASREGMVEIVKLLLEHGANPNKLDQWMGANSGHKAAFWGRTEVMKVLVVHGLDLNAKGLYNGYTPLHDAVSGNHIETARVLIDAGARTDIQGHDGKTPIDIAKENDNGELLQALKSKKSL
jgi:ankyrin repeat protein